MRGKRITTCDPKSSQLEQSVSAVTSFFAGFTTKRWIICDVLIAMVALYAGYINVSPVLYKSTLFSQLVFLSFWSVISGVISGAYDNDTLVKFWKLIFAIIAMNMLTVLGLSLYTNLILYEQIGRLVLLKIAILLFFGSGGLRLIVYAALRYFKINVLLIGNERMKSFIADKISNLGRRYALVGFCDGEDNNDDALGTFDDIPYFCKKYNVHLVIISDYYTKHSKVLDKCLLSTKSGCKLVSESMFFEKAFDIVLVDRIDPGWFYTAKINVHNNFQVTLKRLIDICFAIFGLILTVIIAPFIWCAIKYSSGGDIFYSQKRSGQFDRVFTIYKFCTMRPDAEKEGAQWAREVDARITKVGGFLRKTRLDELPQFWNVLKGEMSLVGPRPERPELVAEIEKHVPYFTFRQWVKPGITGFAQIKYRYGASIEDAKEKLKYDLYYIKNWSIFLDLQIILRTFSSIMKGSR